jgi:type I restriction enzyme, S subunit
MMDQWPIEKLGSLCEIKTGRKDVNQGNPEGKYPFFTCAKEHTYSDEYSFEGEALLIAGNGDVGNTSYYHGKFEAYQRTYVLMNFNRVNPRYLFRILDGLLKRTLYDQKLGNTMPYIKKGMLENYPITLPPLSDQKRIVAILDEAFAGIDTAIANTEKNLANAQELFESASKSALEEGNDWHRKTLLELLDLGWITSHLDGNHGGSYPRKNEFVDKGVPYISANCIKNDEVDFSLSKFLTPERALSLKKGIAKNRDVLFAHNATVGPVAMLFTDLDKIILSTSLTYYRCNPDFIIPEYLAHYMRSPIFRSQYELVMGQSTRNQVPITKQREFFHVIPPLEDQREIADSLDRLRLETQRLQSIYQSKLNSMKELKQSLLHKAFSGALTSEDDGWAGEAVA